MPTRPITAVLLAAFVAGLVACRSDSDTPADVPPGAPGATARPGSDEAPPAMPPVAPGTPLSFRARPGWTTEPTSGSMRKAQYRLPSAEGDVADAELVVYHFGTTGGSLQANLDRWADQFAQPDGGSSRELLHVSTRQVHGMPVTLVDLSGEYRAETSPGSGVRIHEPGYRMLAAVIESDHGSYYVKLVGPSATVTRWEDDFQAFVGDCRPGP